MNRKRILFLTMLGSLSVGLGFLLFAGGACQSPSLSDQRPNILFISIDSLRADHLSSYGYHRPTSPNLDRLAQEGARFTRVLSPSPWRLPSHISMFTGQETTVHHIMTPSFALTPAALSIPKLLKQAGYATVGFGCAPYLKGLFGFNLHFDSYDDSLAQVSYNKSHGLVTSKKVIDKAIAKLGKLRRQRWFMFIHMWDVHYDYIPPAPFNAMFAGDYRGQMSMVNWERNRDFRVGMDPADFDYAISQYDGEIAWVDSQLQRLFERLKKWKLYDQTAIVVVSDHGEEFLDHNQKGHGHSLFDELVRVPLIIKAPQVPPGATPDCMVSTLDLLPTFAEWAQAKNTGYEGPGQSLLGLIWNARTCDATREFFMETNLSNLDKLNHSKRGTEMALEIDRKKFIDRTTEPKRELFFDLTDDPLEQRDLLAADPAAADQMRELLMRHAEKNQESRRRLKLSRRVNADKHTLNQLKDLGYIQ